MANPRDPLFGRTDLQWGPGANRSCGRWPSLQGPVVQGYCGNAQRPSAGPSPSCSS